MRSHVVSRASCAVVARELDLGARLLGQGGELQAGELERLAKNRNVLAALLEAHLDRVGERLEAANLDRAQMHREGP